jgi:hypothetical protein
MFLQNLLDVSVNALFILTSVPRTMQVAEMPKTTIKNPALIKKSYKSSFGRKMTNNINKTPVKIHGGTRLSKTVLSFDFSILTTFLASMS